MVVSLIRANKKHISPRVEEVKYAAIGGESKFSLVCSGLVLISIILVILRNRYSVPLEDGIESGEILQIEVFDGIVAFLHGFVNWKWCVFSLQQGINAVDLVNF